MQDASVGSVVRVSVSAREGCVTHKTTNLTNNLGDNSVSFVPVWFVCVVAVVH